MGVMIAPGGGGKPASQGRKFTLYASRMQGKKGVQDVLDNK
jgi:hypothetical protein